MEELMAEQALTSVVCKGSFLETTEDGLRWRGFPGLDTMLPESLVVKLESAGLVERVSVTVPVRKTKKEG